MLMSGHACGVVAPRVASGPALRGHRPSGRLAACGEAEEWEAGECWWGEGRQGNGRQGNVGRRAGVRLRVTRRGVVAAGNATGWCGRAAGGGEEDPGGVAEERGELGVELAGLVSGECLACFLESCGLVPDLGAAVAEVLPFEEG